MKANKQSKIKVNKSGFNRSRFNWSHDVNTTFTWGEIQPTQCKLLIPNSKTTMKTEELIRLAPMVAPTFGRVKYKTFNQFVSIGEIFPNFDAMMAQEPKSTAYGTKKPVELPSVMLGQLSTWVLQGSRATIYWVPTSLNATDAAAAAVAGKYITHYKKWTLGTGWTYDTEQDTIYSVLTDATVGPFARVTNPYNPVSLNLPNVGSRVVMYPKLMDCAWNSVYGAVGSTYNQYRIVTGLGSVRDLFPVDRSYIPNQAIDDDNLKLNDSLREVTLESADYVIEFTVTLSGTKYYFALAIECSDFGKRLRKVFQGCGYQVDFTSTKYVSILPLIAQYKAYFDVFGLQLYQGWETTYCAQLIKYIENNFRDKLEIQDTGFASMPSGVYPNVTQERLFVQFIIQELASEFYTDNVDYISAHISNIAVSPTVDPSGFISVTSSGTNQNAANVDNATIVASDGTAYNQNEHGSTVIGAYGHAFIDQVQHGQVDADLLMRIYRWTNRNTLLGREIAKILRAQGLGKYVDECKSNFIGSTDSLITISDVVSMADTATGNNGQGALLGEYGGKGLQYLSNGVLEFENDEYGYWITLATIVPEAGYTQGLDPTLSCLDKFSLYNADFDAIGMELTPKDVIVGSRSLIPMTPDASGHESFGFIPRYSKFKVAQNLVNGDFNRHGKRNVYLPYTLDKQLYVNDFKVQGEKYNQATGGNFSNNVVQLNRSVTNYNLPVAGNIWRMPTKYSWLGNFNRIFANVGEREDEDSIQMAGTDNDQYIVGFSDYNDDNFLSHAIYDVQCYAPMKPIEDSYGLDDVNPDKAGAEFVAKA